MGSCEESVVSVEGVTFRYRRKKIVLHSVDLSVGVGACALLGPNGAGKTTLLDIFAGLREPSSGVVHRDYASMSSRADILSMHRSTGYLQQNFGFMPGFTVKEFVSYAAWLKNVPSADVPTRVMDAVESVELADSINAKMRTLSGGMLRRAGIAAASVHSPQLLLLDEPTAGLDPAQRVLLRRVLLGLAETTAIVISTHLTDDVKAVCSRVVVLNDGVIRFDGSPDQLAALSVSANSTDGLRTQCALLAALNRSIVSMKPTTQLSHRAKPAHTEMPTVGVPTLARTWSLSYAAY